MPVRSRSRSRSRSRHRRGSPLRHPRESPSPKHKHVVADRNEDSRRREGRCQDRGARSPGIRRTRSRDHSRDASKDRRRNQDRGGGFAAEGGDGDRSSRRERDADTDRGRFSDRGPGHGSGRDNQVDRRLSCSPRGNRREGKHVGSMHVSDGRQQGRSEEHQRGGVSGEPSRGERSGAGRSRHAHSEDHDPSHKEQWGRPEDHKDKEVKTVVVQPIMELSGKLAAETNKVLGTVLKYQPPPDAAKPDKKWRLYVFKGDALAEEDPLYLHRNDCCLFGRDRSVVDVLCSHPSISKQHAVLQFRRTSKADDFGLNQTAIRPYLMDLETVNGTLLNGEKIESHRYYELLPKDVIKFGLSTRDYVLLYEELARGG